MGWLQGWWQWWWRQRRQWSSVITTWTNKYKAHNFPTGCGGVQMSGLWTLLSIAVTSHGRHGVINNRLVDCFFNSHATTQKTCKTPPYWSFERGIQRWPVFPHKGPVMRKTLQTHWRNCSLALSHRNDLKHIVSNTFTSFKTICGRYIQMLYNLLKTVA